jgi:hypothetical protein
MRFITLKSHENQGNKAAIKYIIFSQQHQISTGSLVDSRDNDVLAGSDVKILH